MLKRTATHLVAAALLVAGAHGSALAQDAQVREVQPASPELQKHAVENLRVLISGLQSDKVETEIKDVLVACLFENSLREISEAVDKAIAANSERFDRSKPSQLLGVMVGVCGYQPPEQPAGR